MKVLLIFLIFFVLALLETTILPLNLCLAAIILWAALVPSTWGLWTAFLAGLTLDIFSGRSLGTFGFLFLLAVLPVEFYKNRFQADRLRFLLPYLFLVIIFYNLFWGYFYWLWTILTILSVIIILPILKVVAKKNDEEAVSF